MTDRCSAPAALQRHPGGPGKDRLRTHAGRQPPAAWQPPLSSIADSVALMHHGRIVHEDTPDGFRRLIAPREISLELSGPSEALIAELGALPGVSAVCREDGRLRLRTAAPERTMASVLSVVHRLGLAPTGIQVVRPDLAEVFRHLVGS